MIERHNLMNYYNYCKASQEIAFKRECHYNKMNHFRKVALMADKMLNELPDDADALLRRSLKRDVVAALAEFDEQLGAYELCENHQIQHKKNPCCKQYMHPKDFRIYNFLLGFEEFLYGAQLEKVQFSCTSHLNKEQGSTIRRKFPLGNIFLIWTLSVEKGVANLIEQIAEKRQLDIRYHYKVCDIDYNSDDHVTLTIEKDGNEILEMHPAFVVSTLPIGVLKKWVFVESMIIQLYQQSKSTRRISRSIVEDSRAPSFSPPLPEDKKKVIRNMGSALVNKVVMVFERAFWDANGRHQFCNISPSA